MYDYEFINQYDGLRSTTGTVENDLTTRYFARCLYQRATSIFDFNLPKEWNKQYFTNVLFSRGFIGVINTPEYGVIPQVCTLSGYGLYMNPTTILVSQPLVSFKGEIGEDCELIKLTPDYQGIMDIVEHYAIQLSTVFTSIKSSLVNSRLAYLLLAKDKATAETLKIVAEKISAGETTIICDKHLKGDDLSGNEPIYTEAYNPKDSYITDLLLSDMQTILNSFDSEIGIPTVNSKKERMIDAEANYLISDSISRKSLWSSCLDETFDNVNSLFNLNISYSERGVDYGKSSVVPDRTI